jgi:hypothetical protein
MPSPHAQLSSILIRRSAFSVQRSGFNRATPHQRPDSVRHHHAYICAKCALISAAIDSARGTWISG